MTGRSGIEGVQNTTLQADGTTDTLHLAPGTYRAVAYNQAIADQEDPGQALLDALRSAPPTQVGAGESATISVLAN